MSSTQTHRPPEPDAPAGTDLLQVVKLGLRRSRRWIVPFVIIGTMIGLYFALVQQNVFTSEAKLLLRAGSRERVSSESLAAISDEDRSARPTQQDEIHMLLDEAIYEKVARDVGPAEILRPDDPMRDDGPETSLPTRIFHATQAGLLDFGDRDHVCTPGGCRTCIASAVDVLRTNVRLESDRDSNVIRVTYTAGSPERARAITQALVKAYVDRHAQQFSVEPFLEKNRPKLEAAVNRRDSTAKAYFDHVETCGIVDLEVQRRVLIEAVMDVEREHAAAILKRDELLAERNAVLERLKSSSAQIDLVRERAPNPVYLALRERIQDLDVESTTNEARIEGLSKDLADARKRLDGMRECERTHATLSTARDLEAARCLEVQRRFALLEDLSALDVQADSNLVVLQQPTLNFKKDGPKRAKMLVAAFFGSLLVAVWLATMRELFDRRLRHAPMVERQLGVRLLGSIPEYSSRDLVA